MKKTTEQTHRDDLLRCKTVVVGLRTAVDISKRNNIKAPSIDAALSLAEAEEKLAQSRVTWDEGQCVYGALGDSMALVRSIREVMPFINEVLKAHGAAKLEAGDEDITKLNSCTDKLVTIQLMLPSMMEVLEEALALAHKDVKEAFFAMHEELS